jgi:prepilin-type N-terminal cleavage/methylation domain-containing protein
MCKRRGVSLIELLVVLAILAVVIALTAAAIQRARAAAARAQCQDNLRQLGIALTGYHDVRKVFPPGTSSQDAAFPFLNWQARLLPYLEQDGLWSTIESAYAQQPNFLGAAHVGRAIPISVFCCPAGDRTVLETTAGGPAFTYYLGVLGRDSHTLDGMLFVDSRVRLADVRDGTANTVFVGERPPSPDGNYGWWYAGWGQRKDGTADAVLGVRQVNRPRPRTGDLNDLRCPRGPYEFALGSLQDHCDTFHFWSLHTGGANFLFVNGSVRFLSYDANSVIVALATRAGGEVVPELP